MFSRWSKRKTTWASAVVLNSREVIKIPIFVSIKNQDMKLVSKGIKISTLGIDRKQTPQKCPNYFCVSKATVESFIAFLLGDVWRKWEAYSIWGTKEETQELRAFVK